MQSIVSRLCEHTALAVSVAQLIVSILIPSICFGGWVWGQMGLGEVLRKIFDVFNCHPQCSERFGFFQEVRCLMFPTVNPGVLKDPGFFNGMLSVFHCHPRCPERP